MLLSLHFPYLLTGALGEAMNDLDKALYCYENTLRHNPYNMKALTQITAICRAREQFPKVRASPQFHSHDLSANLVS